MRSYRIDRRAEARGGGFVARFFEDGEEAGGCVVPLGPYLEQACLVEEASDHAFWDAWEMCQEWVEPGAGSWG